ncbi:MAG: cytochrome c [Deltaproteobacteria bacterium]|nr:cytochrome c [Deltaproteobacteria bacterium]
MRRKRIFVGAILLTLGCGQGGERSPAEQGQRIYVANCTACHNPNPVLDGTLGPAVAGSSRALIEARLLRAEYPPGYTPKRLTQQMVVMPYLEPYIDVLAAYLAEP